MFALSLYLDTCTPWHLYHSVQDALAAGSSLHVLISFLPATAIITLSTLVSTTFDILCSHYHLYNQLLKIKYACNLKTLIYVET